MRRFDCRGEFENKNDFQRYDLERKAYNTKITIQPPDEMNPVPVENKDQFILVGTKNQPLNLTCIADVGCNDINYDIKFTTNTTVRIN